MVVKEPVPCFQERVEGDKQLAMGDLTTELPPPHLDDVEPGAVDRQVEPHQPPCRGADDGLDVLIEMGVGMIPGDIDGAGRMAVDPRTQKLGHLPAPPAAAAQYHGFARLGVDGAQPIPLLRLAWGENRDVLTPRAPHGAQGGQPADMACVRLGLLRQYL